MSYKNYNPNFLNRGKYIFIVFTLISIWAGMYILNYQTPETRDDYYHKFILDRKNGKNVIVKKVESFQEILSLQPFRYFNRAGRTFVSITEHTFTSLIGKSNFNYVNSLVFAIFILALASFIGKITPFNILFTFSVILFLFPIFSDTCLWMSGSINYLWPCTGITIFLAFILKYNKRYQNPYYSYLWSLPSFIIGWSHESIAFPLALSFIFSILFFRKTKYSKLKTILLFAFILGACFCFFSPGNFERFNDYDLKKITIINRFSAGIFLFSKLRAFFILLLGFLTLTLFHHHKEGDWGWIRNFYSKNHIVINALICSFAFLFVSGLYVMRVATGPEFYSIILILSLFNDIKTNLAIWIKSISIVASIGLLTGIFYYTNLNYTKLNEIYTQFQDRTSEVILYDYVDIPFLFPRYIEAGIINDEWGIQRQHTKFIARVYNFNDIVFLPSRIHHLITSGKIPADISKQENLPYYIILLDNFSSLRKINDDEMEITLSNWENKLKFMRDKNKILKIHNRIYLFSAKDELNDKLLEDIRQLQSI